MYVINEDNSIYITRGDILAMSVTAEDKKSGKAYKFKAGDIVRINIHGRKECDNVVLQKDFPIALECDAVDIFLTEKDTKIGESISKPKDYWYEVVLNPDTNPQTIIGYDDDNGPIVFKLFPEGGDIEEDEPIAPEDIPIVDEALDISSSKPVENKAIAREIIRLEGAIQSAKAEAEAMNSDVSAKASQLEDELSVERARITNLATAETVDAELIDIRVGVDGKTYESAGVSVREQVRELTNDDDAVRKAVGLPKYTNFAKSIMAASETVTDTSGTNFKQIKQVGRYSGVRLTAGKYYLAYADIKPTENNACKNGACNIKLCAKEVTTEMATVQEYFEHNIQGYVNGTSKSIVFYTTYLCETSGNYWTWLYATSADTDYFEAIINKIYIVEMDSLEELSSVLALCNGASGWEKHLQGIPSVDLKKQIEANAESIKRIEGRMLPMSVESDRAIITFIDDDGASSYLEKIKPSLDARGWKGSIAVVTDYVGTPNHLRVSELSALKQNGFDILSHSKTHLASIWRYDAVNDGGIANVREAIDRECRESQEWFFKNGFGRISTLVYPYSGYSAGYTRQEVEKICGKYYQNALSTSSAIMTAYPLESMYLNRTQIKDAEPLDTYKTLIDKCKEANGWLIFFTHAGIDCEISASVFEELCDYVEKSGVSVMNFESANAIKRNICSLGVYGVEQSLYIGRDGTIKTW